MQGAIYLTKGHAALRTTAGLGFSFLQAKIGIDLVKICNAVFGFTLIRHRF